MTSEPEEQRKELSVCDIMGDWGAYQSSLTLFAIVYSAIIATTVVVGPIWTPNLRHVCAPANLSALSSDELLGLKSSINFTLRPNECARLELVVSDVSKVPSEREVECEAFIYDDAQIGTVLTNSFDLVCGREWLKSFLSSSALAGMLISSVTLGLLSDKYGRMCCIQVGVWIAILATIGAILSHNYLLLNICIMLMSFAQVGVANALCTLVMEATSPRFRFVPVFEYGTGWGLGVILTPFLQELVGDYAHFLGAVLLWQLLMLPWLHFGVFESVRWLLSEGKINRAQIELQRACRINRVQNGAKLAQEIAEIQAQQVRKASRVIEEDLAPARLARALEQRVETTSQELDLLSAAIRGSFGLAPSAEHQASSGAQPEQEQERADCSGNSTMSSLHIGALAPNGLSPSLKRRSFSVLPSLPVPEQSPAGPHQQPQPLELSELADQQLSELANQKGPKLSLTTQGLIQLAMRYRKALEREEGGHFFLAQMFHRKLWKRTLLFMLLSVMLETSYYGFIQATKFVGDNVTINYVASGLGEIVAASLYMLVFWAFSRPLAVSLPTCIGSLACLGLALTYHLIPDQRRPHSAPSKLSVDDIGISEFKDQVDSLVIASDNLTAVVAPNSTGPLNLARPQSQAELLQLRDTINFWLMNVGKLVIAVGMQVAATTVMESYPNNLRQTGSGVIIFVGRVGSIIAPFLFNDLTEDRIVFKSTLVTMAAIGFVVCILTPFLLKTTKNKELCDHMQDIDD